MVTPRYLADVTAAGNCPRMEYSVTGVPLVGDGEDCTFCWMELHERRNLKISSISIKEQAYKTLVRPLVEYASPVWDPHHQTDIRKLECVQRRAAMFVLSSLALFVMESMCWLQFTLSP
jgi:hypothetical protein